MNQLEELKENMAKDIYGMTRNDAWEKGVCLDCGELADPKCYSVEGKAEYRISGLCEICFDKMFEGE
jgi:hypothetical protein